MTITSTITSTKALNLRKLKLINEELTEEIMLGAVNYGHEQMQTIINAIDELEKVLSHAE